MSDPAVMHPLDWAVLALYALTVVGLGAWAGRKERDADDFFLAGRGMSWIPVAASSLATALSALTFIGVPGAAFGGDFGYLQLWLGTFVSSLLLARWFLPVFYRLAGASRINQVPTNHRSRAAGESKYSNFGRLRKTIWDLFAVRWMISRWVDLRNL